MHKRSKFRTKHCGVWEPLRDLRRQLIAKQNHAIYAARGNEQPLLQELAEADPPHGGMEAYIADLNRKLGKL